MNPELTYTVPPYQTGVGSVDILAHTLNRYLTKDLPVSHLGDEFAEGLMRDVVKYAPIALANPTDYEARAELMMAAAFSHNDITWLGRSGLRGNEHALEHQFSGHYDTPHGAGLAVIMPAFLKYIVDTGTPEQAARVAQFAVKVFGVSPDMGDVKATACAGISVFRAWIHSLGMPLSMDELGVPKAELPDMVKRTLDASGGKVPGFLDLDEKAVTDIFKLMV
jgi:alcohol dehydrogenase YqhD (iron-dependent ADH family)